jgi:hypothetical protein
MLIRAKIFCSFVIGAGLGTEIGGLEAIIYLPLRL